MLDGTGRIVAFAGKRKMVKTADVAEDGTVSVRFDFVNGETRTLTVPPALMTKFAAHGAAQKVGDEAAGVADIDDIVVAIDEVITRLHSGEWGATREAGDGFSGASIVIRAIMEATGKDQETVKAFLQKKLDAATANGEKLTRQALYSSFRHPSSKTGKIIERMEAEKAVKAPAVNSDEYLSELS
jgi:hypothetical protein